jgi:tRNA wybutosine-synthesizing protein 3
MRNPFLQRKKWILSKLQAEIDKSPKGSIDEPILDLVNYLNSLKEYVTTSSCSGRVAIYAGNEESGRWLFVTHEVSEIDGLNLHGWIERTLQPVYTTDTADALQHTKSLVYFKFEPFIVHAEASTLDAASALHKLALAAGYRNSGLTVSKNRFMVAIRSSPKLDAPIGFLDASNKFCSIVSLDHLSLLFQLSIHKFNDNNTRRSKFLSQLHASFTP